MLSSLASFEFRRWALAVGLTLLLVSLQVAYAARAIDGGVAANGTAGGAAAGGRPAPPVIPVQVTGTIVAAQDGLLGVHETDAPAPVSFALSNDALLIRDGAATGVDDLRPGDRVRMTIDGGTGRILQLRADPAAMAWRDRLDTLGPLAALALIATLGLLAVRRRVSARAGIRPRPTSTPTVPSPAAPTRFGRVRPAAVRHQNRRCAA